MAELQQLILDTLNEKSTIPDTRALVIPGESSPAVSQDAQITILGALNSLLSRDVRLLWYYPRKLELKHLILQQMITLETHEISSHVLTQEGAQIALEGSHEARVWSVLPEKGSGAPMTAQDLKKTVGDETAKIGQGRAFKSGWIGKEGSGFVKLVISFRNRIHGIMLN
jgi:phenylalanyl-tRNA synthetase alpha chain